MTEIQEFIMTPYDDEVYVLKCDHLKAMEAKNDYIRHHEVVLDGQVEMISRRDKTIEAQTKEIENLKENLEVTKDILGQWKQEAKQQSKQIERLKEQIDHLDGELKEAYTW
ncbi:MAG: hypothetical protein OQK29_01340 [Ignavibacteriaceae bacterium]|nr:hypothetical protein [Ignavibacteriaceae bacterium]